MRGTRCWPRGFASQMIIGNQTTRGATATQEHPARAHKHAVHRPTRESRWRIAKTTAAEITPDHDLHAAQGAKACRTHARMHKESAYHCHRSGDGHELGGAGDVIEAEGKRAGSLQAVGRKLRTLREGKVRGYGTCVSKEPPPLTFFLLLWYETHESKRALRARRKSVHAHCECAAIISFPLHGYKDSAANET